MDDQRFFELKRLFSEVCDIPPADRARRLGELTTDPALRDEILALVEAHERGESRATRASSPLSGLLEAAAGPELKAGERLGPWLLKSAIGEGGMGSVFLAERADGHFSQRAAIKLLHGVPTPAALERLAQERQILANLTHPNIARLLDGGATPRGRPFLVMEYIEGRPIDEYCRVRRPERSAILALFASVCEAVAFAHRQLVVHCDLKPSNVLVETGGRAVLLDFGIARLANAVETRELGKAFTPRYASPEQQSGTGVVGTSTDIYSLGVMLADLLAGHPADPELSAIIAKAAAPIAADRYDSVDALREDVARFRDHEPLRALPHTWAYQGRKLVQRRWPLLAAAAGFLLVISAFTWQVVRERNAAEQANVEAQKGRDAARLAEAEAVAQRDRAQEAELEALGERNRAREAQAEAIAERNRALSSEQSAQQARRLAGDAKQQALRSEEAAVREMRTSREVGKFLESLFEGANPEVALRKDATARQILEKGRDRIRSELKDQPAVRASLLMSIAVAFDGIGRTADSFELYQEAEKTERALNPPRPLQLADLCHRLSLALFNASRAVDGTRYAQEALAIRERELGPDSELVAGTLSQLGLMMSNARNWREAEAHLKRAQAIYAKLGKSESENAMAAGHNLSLMYRRVGQLELAETQARETLALKRRVFDARHPKILNTMEILARIVGDQNKLVEAEALTREVLALRVELFGAESDDASRLAMELGMLIYDLGRFGEAIEILKPALEVAIRIHGRRTTVVAINLNNYALVCEAYGDLVCAEAAFRESLDIRREAAKNQPETIARAEANLGRFLMRAGRLDEARPIFDAVAPAIARLYPKEHASAIEMNLTQADWHRLKGNTGQAREMLDGLAPHAPKMRPMMRAWWLKSFVLSGGNGTDLPAALKQLQESEGICDAQVGAENPRCILARLDRAEFLASRGEADAARALTKDIESRLPRSALSEKAAAWNRLAALR